MITGSGAYFVWLSKHESTGVALNTSRKMGNFAKLTIVKTYNICVIEAIEDNYVAVILNQGKCNENFEIWADQAIRGPNCLPGKKYVGVLQLYKLRTYLEQHWSCILAYFDY